MKKRCLYLDVLRILACLAVIFAHSSGNFLFGEREPGGLLYRAELGLSISMRFCVPVFFAISGALMLGREIKADRRLALRVSMTALTLAVFSLVSHAAELVRTGAPLDVRAAVLRLYSDNLNFSYWYLYAYIAFLLITPLLSAMLRSLGSREILYMLGLGLFFRCVLPAFELWRWAGERTLNPDLSLACISCDVVLYPTVGYFLHHRLSVKQCRQWAPAAVLGAAAAVLVCIELTLQAYYRTWVPKVEPVLDPAAMLLGAAVFIAARALLGDGAGDGRAARFAAFAAPLTFGIYLLHVPVLHSSAMTAAIDALRAAVPMPQMLYAFAEVLLTAVVCGAVTFALQRIPGVRRLIGG